MYCLLMQSMNGLEDPLKKPLAWTGCLKHSATPPQASPESRQVVEIPWGLSPGVTGAELTTAQGSGA
jgi:hypothetical protein